MPFQSGLNIVRCFVALIIAIALGIPHVHADSADVQHKAASSCEICCLHKQVLEQLPSFNATPAKLKICQSFQNFCIPSCAPTAVIFASAYPRGPPLLAE